MRHKDVAKKCYIKQGEALPRTVAPSPLCSFCVHHLVPVWRNLPSTLQCFLQPSCQELKIRIERCPPPNLGIGFVFEQNRKTFK